MRKNENLKQIKKFCECYEVQKRIEFCEKKQKKTIFVIIYNEHRSSKSVFFQKKQQKNGLTVTGRCLF